jgi:hypothetical protein
MNFPVADIGALRRRLGAEIDRALETSDYLGATLVGCHLQMARDLLDEPIAPSSGPKPDPGEREGDDT